MTIEELLLAPSCSALQTRHSRPVLLQNEHMPDVNIFDVLPVAHSGDQKHQQYNLRLYRSGSSQQCDRAKSYLKSTLENKWT